MYNVQSLYLLLLHCQYYEFEDVTCYILSQSTAYICIHFLQVHVSTYSNTRDHCSAYALSDPTEVLPWADCDHNHEDSCRQCEVLKAALMEVGNAVADSPLSDDERDDLSYALHQAVQAIESWKAHQLRSIQQDKARTRNLGNLDEKSVQITQDWAMKWLPQRYRETQADWFGKRGISWHVSVAVRRLAGDLEQQTFVHNIEECSQDASAVVQVLQHTLKALKVEHPKKSSAALRQDNAGCYHSVTMLSACHLMGEATGIHVSGVDFSDPPGGKGACDRKAASIKAHVRRYMNEGHDALTAHDFKEAMLSHGGIIGVRVTLLTDIAEKSQQEVAGRWEGISSLNNFLYQGDCVTVWKVYDIGRGKTLSWSQLRGNHDNNSKYN